MATDEQTESTAAEPLVEVSVGHEEFEPGWTRVALDARGSVEVECRLAGAKPRYEEAKLDPERAATMIRRAETEVGVAREGKRQGLPDEPRYHFEIRAGDRRQSIDVWRSELDEHPGLRELVAALQEMLEERTRGEILL